MKSLFILFALLSSCSALPIKDDSQSISKVQECWNIKSLKCIKKYFGTPRKETPDSITYIQNENEYLTVFIDRNKQLIGAQFWIFNSASLNAEAIKKILSTDDWAMENIPEKNPHVVNLAISNFNKKLDVSFLSYQLNPKKLVRVIYWGGDYKNLEF